MGDDKSILLRRGRRKQTRGRRTRLPGHRRLTRLEIAILINNLLDAEVVVDDRRTELERTIEALRVAVQRRDALARDLARAIAAAEHVA